MLMENKNDLPDLPRGTQPDHSRVGITNGEKPFHVLALSGGGFRDLYTATVLKHLEEQLGTQATRRAQGDAALDPIRNHLAANPVFFHGPNKTPENRHA